MNLSSLYAPAQQYALPHTAAVYPHDYTSLPPLASALAPSESPMPGLLQAHHREAIENPDAMARMRAQADLLTRAGVMPNGALALAQPAPTADTSAALPGLYAAAAGVQDGQYDRFTLPAPQWDGRQYQQTQTKDFEAPYGPRSQSHPTVPSFSAAGAAGGEPSLQTHPPTTVTSSSFDPGAGSTATYQHATLPPATSLYTHHPPHHQHSRSDDVSSSEGDFGSDAGSTSTGPSHSIPSSASSSAVHLPLPGLNNFRTRSDKEAFDQRYPTDAQGQTHPHEGEGGFSSAFGLMSLDDPNVIAGLASDGQPFFSGLTPSGFTPGNLTGPGGLLATPTQDLIAQLKSAGGREGENKDMRDFWKMYLKTPLTGPNSAGGLMFPLQTPTGPGAQLGSGLTGSLAGRPSPTRRHSRVASLPSMKTPPLFTDERYGSSFARPSTGDHYDSHPHPSQSQHAQQPAGGYNSTVRTTLHDAEDLKSYEQAVLARKAPMNLNLIPKRKGSLANPSTGGAPPNPAAMKSKSMSPVVPHSSFPANVSSSVGGGSKIAELLNRPGSSSSAGTSGTNESAGSGMSAPSETSTANTTVSQASSSLAHAFGSEHGAPSAPDSQVQASGAGSYLSAPTYRPSFKRIASQTLGPENAKRALLGPAGWDHDEEDEEGEEGIAEEEEEEEHPSARMTIAEGARQASLAAPTLS